MGRTPRAKSWWKCCSVEVIRRPYTCVLAQLVPYDVILLQHGWFVVEPRHFLRNRVHQMRRRKRTFEEYLGAMFSLEHRDNLADGCPMTASASDVARQGTAVATSFANAFEETATVLEESIGGEMPAIQKRQIAISALAAQIGAIAVARAVARVNPSLSKEVLRSVQETVTPAPPARTNKAKRSRLPHLAR
jgi:hypothetical protein